jgi:hypothetical protein
MKKVEPELDELRPEYRREDFGKMVRGKYAQQIREASNVVVIDPDVQKAFPNSKAVNDALRGLLALAESTGLVSSRTKRAVSPPGNAL